MLYERTHKSIVLVGFGGEGKDGKEAVRDVSANNPRPTTNKEGMAMLSMEVSMVGMTWYGVDGPCRS